MGRTVAIALTALTLGACNYSGQGHVYPGYGEATAHNAAVMIIDPNPPGAENTDIPLDGSRGVLVQERYQTDTVEEPVVLTTTSSLSGGGAE
jgi:hypothetical protein